MGDTTRIIASTASHALGTWRDVVVVVWRGAVEDAAIEALDTAVREAAHVKETRVGILVVVEATAPIPTDARRAMIADLMMRVEGRVVAAATAFDGGGFRAAAVRGVTTWFTLVNRLAYPQKTFAVTSDAVAWLAQRLEGAPLEELGKAVEAIRNAPAE